MSPRAREGVGQLIPLIAVVVGGLLVLLASSFLTTSGTARTLSRVADLRILMEVCQAAAASSVQTIRASIARSGAAGSDGFSWRQALVPPYDRARPERSVSVPRALLERFDRDLDVQLTDVEVRVVDWWEPPTYDPMPYCPQGVLEMKVTATIDRGNYRVKRSIVQRRVFYVTLRPAPAGTTVTVDRADIFVASVPLVTCILP